jgi:hypothetical protein
MALAFLLFGFGIVVESVLLPFIIFFYGIVAKDKYPLHSVNMVVFRFWLLILKIGRLFKEEKIICNP